MLFFAPTGALGEGILCVSESVIFCKITVKMGSNSILKSPGGSRASKRAGKQVSR